MRPRGLKRKEPLVWDLEWLGTTTCSRPRPRPRPRPWTAGPGTGKGLARYADWVSPSRSCEGAGLRRVFPECAEGRRGEVELWNGRQLPGLAGTRGITEGKWPPPWSSQRYKWRAQDLGKKRGSRNVAHCQGPDSLEKQRVVRGSRPFVASCVRSLHFLGSESPLLWNLSVLPPSNTSNCSESADFQYILFPVVYSLVFVLGLAGNLFVLGYFLRTRSATAPANVFLVNLATIDLLFVLTLPFRITYHAHHNDWIFGEALCKITGCLFFANLYGSSLFLSCICLERYVAVVHPLRHLRFRQLRYRVGATLGVWLVLLVAILFLALCGPLTSIFADGRTACLENFSSSSWKERISGISIFAAVVGFLLPLLLIGVCYPLIAWRLLVSPGVPSGSSAVRRKALRTVLVVLGVFLVCFAPYHLVQLVHTLGRVGALGGCSLLRTTYVARRLTMALTSLNACLDPLVYYFAAERFTLQRSWWKCGCCQLGGSQQPLGLPRLGANQPSSSGEVTRTGTEP